MKKASKKQLEKMASEANPYKVGSPYGLDTRGYKEGYPAGYEQRDKEIKMGRISDEELLARFDEAVRQPNMIVGDAALCVKIAKDYADGIK